MKKIILSLIIVSGLVLSSLSYAGEEVDYGNLMTPRSSSPSSGSSSYVISTAPGVHFTYGKGGGMSITSSDGGYTTFYPAFGHRSTVVPVPKVVHCVNTGSVSYCY